MLRSQIYLKKDFSFICSFPVCTSYLSWAWDAINHDGRGQVNVICRRWCHATLLGSPPCVCSASLHSDSKAYLENSAALKWLEAVTTSGVFSSLSRNAIGLKNKIYLPQYSTYLFSLIPTLEDGVLVALWGCTMRCISEIRPTCGDSSAWFMFLFLSDGVLSSDMILSVSLHIK